MHADVKKNAVGGFKKIKLLDTNGQTILSYRAAHTDLREILVILKLENCI
jgi:hypothetical protein